MGRLFTIFLLVTGGLMAPLQIAQAQTEKNSAALDSTTPSDFELLNTRYRFENDGTGQKEVTARIRVFTWAGVMQWPELSFDYKPSHERVQILYVRILKKDGRVVNVNTDKILAPRGIFREGGIAGFDFNDKRVAMPSFAPGDSIEYDVETVVHTPLTPGQFSEVYSFTPCRIVDEQLEINIPADREVKLKTKPGIGMSIANESGRRIYRWAATHEGSKCDGVRNKAMVQDLLEQTPDVQISTFASWEDVGRWYAEMERGRRVPSPAVRSKADELTQGMKTDLEKVAALYAFTATKIKYFSMVSFGIGGYEPHTADEVLRSGYGDCKDKDTLLSALLEAEGFHSSSVLINPFRSLDPDVPSPWPFTHVITMLPLGREEIWMDSSSGVLPLRMLPYTLRQKKALVIPPTGVPHFEETPAEAPIESSVLEMIDGKVDAEGSLDASVSITACGDSAALLRQSFLAAAGSELPATVRAVIKGVSEGVSDVKVSGTADFAEPFQVSFRVHTPKFLRVNGKISELTLPMSDFSLAGTNDVGQNESDAGNSKPVEFGPPGEYTYRVKLEVEPTQTLEGLSPVSLERSFGAYKARYRVQGNLLLAERKLTLRTNEAPPIVMGDYAAFREKVLADTATSLRIVPR
jgi:hypothetical protein